MGRSYQQPLDNNISSGDHETTTQCRTFLRSMDYCSFRRGILWARLTWFVSTDDDYDDSYNFNDLTYLFVGTPNFYLLWRNV